MSTAHDRIALLLAPPRLAPYLDACGGDTASAQRLYQWNTAVSGAFYETLQALEIALRNALVRELETWHGNHPGHWYEDHKAVFDAGTGADIEEGKRG